MTTFDLVGFASYFHRRVVRADLKPSEMVTALAASPVQFGDYLREGQGDRRFTRFVGILVTVIAIGSVVIGLVAPWLPADASAKDPEWSLWAIALPWSLGFAWLSALQIAGLRAMYRHRQDPPADA